MMFRIAAVSFLNTVPLVDWLSHANRDDIELTLELPSRLAEALRRDEADVALVPVVDILRGETGGLLPVSGIACKGAVDSVKIFSYNELPELKTIAADRGSHSSIALLRVLLAEMYGQHPHTRAVKPTVGVLPGDCEGILIIGDRCFQYERYLRESGARDVKAWDLGQLWWGLTGLPFVFATWAVAPGYVARVGQEALGGMRDVLGESLRSGLQNLSVLAEREAARGRLGPGGYATSAAIDYYFRQSLRFTIGEGGLAGIDRFHRLALEHEIVTEKTAPTIL